MLHLSWDFSVLVEYKRLITSVNTKPSCCHNHRKTVHAILVINQEPYQPHHPCAGCYLILNHLSKLLPSLHTGSVSNRLEDVMKMSSGGLLLRLWIKLSKLHALFSKYLHANIYSPTHFVPGHAWRLYTLFQIHAGKEVLRPAFSHRGKLCHVTHS